MNFLFGALAFVTACGVASRPGDENNNVCGDGRVANQEQCDDGNTEDGDGCSSTCKNEGSQAECGDGVVGQGEACDDGNIDAADGCNSTCGVEPGYSCTGSPSICVNSQVTDGTCGNAFSIAFTNDNGTLVGVGSGDTTNSTDQVAEAACDGFDSGAGKDHVWKFTLTDTRDVMILMDEELSMFDTVLRVMSAPCDVGTEISEFQGADGCADGIGAAEFMGWVSMAPGTYYIVVDGFTAEDFGAYKFDIIATPPGCGNGTLDPLEFCDDGGGAVSGDGCDSKCEVETGFSCDINTEPSVCTADNTSAVPPAPGDIIINEFMAADNASDTNCDGSTTSNADEFVEIVNVSASTLDLANVTIADSVIVRHTFPAGTTVAPGKAIVVWGGGAPNCPGVDNFQIASGGQLGLNDAENAATPGIADTITIADAAGVTLTSVSYGQATLNVSFNLQTEMSGTTYVLHNAMPGVTTAFSPGKKANGTAF